MANRFKKEPKWEQPYRAILGQGNLSIKDHREILGLCIKYIIDPRLWDCCDLMELRSFKGKRFHKTKYCEPMIRAFNSRKRKEMEANTQENKLLKSIVYYDQGLNKTKCNKQVRIRRLKRLIKEFRKAIKKYNPTDKIADKCIINFALTILNGYIRNYSDHLKHRI